MNKLRRFLLLLRSLFIELFRHPIIVQASVTIGYDGQPIPSNWGDDINFWFLKEISKQPIIIYNQSVINRLFRKTHILGIGSILGMFSNSRSIVWGSGILDSTITAVEPPHEIRAVRGPITRLKLLDMGIDCPAVYGDPALLLSRWYNPSIIKKYKIGVIAQYSARQKRDAHHIFGDHPDVHYIDIANYSDWHYFIDEILSCEIILSSSLHGLIVAESYKIPSLWIEFPTNSEIYRLKYEDFYASLGKKCKPVKLTSPLNLDLIYGNIAKWKPGNIDLQPLIDSAPFELKL